MPTRQLRDERPPTDPDDLRDSRDPRDPVLIGDIIAGTLAEIARRAAPRDPFPIPAQRTRPHP